jgi:signal transduction histidine kinase/ActR/RegA family two-component response regulator
VQFYAGAPLITSAGFRIGTLCVLDNVPREMAITQKEALAALARLVVAQLDQRMQNAELRRYQAELTAAKLAAESAREAKARLLANMSHEIRNPMSGIVGMSQLLLEAKLGDAEREKVRIIYNCGQSLLSLSNNILDFSKLEAQALELELVPFPLKEISGDVVKLFGFVPGRDGVKITLDCAPSVPDWVKGDGNRYRQVLSNLVSNAVKFAGKGEVRVSLRMEDRPVTGSRLYVMVSDTGAGIAPDALPRLFQNFAQADASVARRFGGSGLGLAICKGLCEAMGGDISVHSELGKGSTFEFSLPLRAVAAPAQAEGAEIAHEEDPQGVLRVLVVDDNLVNLRLANAFLTKYGCLVDTAEDGAAGLAKAVAGEYDLVLMDCQMPGMDGYESASLIVKALGKKRPKIFALTGNTDPADVAACLKAGMDGVLGKPLAIKEVQSLLHSVRLERQGVARSLWSK